MVLHLHCQGAPYTPQHATFVLEAGLSSSSASLAVGHCCCAGDPGSRGLQGRMFAECGIWRVCQVGLQPLGGVVCDATGWVAHFVMYHRWWEALAPDPHAWLRTYKQQLPCAWLIVIPATTVSPAHLQGLAAAIAAGNRRVCTYDRLGYGWSDPVKHDYNLLEVRDVGIMLLLSSQA